MKTTYKTGLVLVLAAFGLMACGKSEDAKDAKVDQAELIASINGDLSTAEHNCVAVPVRFDEPVEKDYAKLTEPNGAQLEALVKVGLIKADPVEGGKVSFTATDAGKEVYSGLAGTGGPGFCAGEVTVASITEDKSLEEREKLSRHVVTYQYKFEHPAAWQSDPAVRTAFPKLAELIDQAGKQPLKSELTNRGTGWNVVAPSSK
ncbi:hypothetical protein IGB42_01359 [Andreprevotia sp. IGB-42]|uniref:hypothetical protein n=1 Tax=Andreprevotia sp. IGB-42 TaxID=2497473 RepID=UPI00135689D4|nr:hypothetical protein [Andreprevotia sp. IGB-42]KAF0814458.1 hypothetical protein IGB42_01359 [Andreprevotia sp. IGB-42]